MSRPTAARRRPAAGRRGTILIVVLALLAIFAVIGIAFVFYSDGEALAARYHRESQTGNGAMRPSAPARFESDAETVFGKLIFGDYNDQLNGYRGHDLMSAMYGGNTGQTGGANTDPYTGQGIFHEKMAAPFDVVPSRGHVVSYVPMSVGVDAKNQPLYFAFDPEITGPPRFPAKAGDPLPTPANVNSLSSATGQVYVSKAAPYTYPDLNNFYLASLSPGTGEVLVPSFLRMWHFNSNPVPLGGAVKAPPAAPVNRRLEPWNPADTVLKANTDWVIPEGRAKILRPRPIDQLTATDFALGIPTLGIPPLPFPLAPQLGNYSAAQLSFLFSLIDAKIRTGDIIAYPRPNFDGLVTGDVMNLIGGVGVQRSDSILVDFGAQPFNWPPGSNNQIKPMAAVLITDLDGSLNLNAHGNTRNAGNHISHHGLGPWEVNLAGAIGNVPEGNGVVSARYGSFGQPGARNGTTTLAYDPSGVRFNTNSLVNWDGTGKASGVTPPSFPTNPFNSVANYGPGGFYDDNTSTTQPVNHPALFNPGDWANFPEGKALNPLPPQPVAAPPAPFGFTYSIADTRRLRQRYAGELELYQQMTTFRIPVAPTNSLIGNGTTYPPGSATYRFDPAHSRRLMVTTLSADLDRARLMGVDTKNPTGTPTFPSIPAGAHPFNNALNGTLSPGSAATILPALDLNRRLTDYRPDTSKALSPTNINPTNTSNSDQAWADRHNLARDVFARLIIATGADKNSSGASVDPATGDITLPDPANTNDYNALRYLAQVAVNVVDYVDNDDVSTVFVWNPSGGGKKLTTVDATTVVTNATTDLPSNNGDRVVYGVERPRLVINEAYAEVTNDPSEAALGAGPAAKNGQVRLWVELLNPSGDVTKSEYLGGSDGPLNDGSVQLYVAGTHRPYRLQVAKGSVEGGNIFAAANADGRFTNDPLVDFRFDSTDIVNNAPKQTVTINKGTYAGPNGIVVVGPKVPSFNAAEMKSDPTAAPWNAANYAQSEQISDTATSKSNAMGYALPLPTAGALESFSADLGRHIVLLRRLANPYLPEGPTNPYVTVDVMDYVPVHDAVHRAMGDVADRGSRAMPPGPGNTQLASRFSVGKVQPYAGYSTNDPAAAMGTQPQPAGFPQSFVIPQVDKSNAALPQNSFFRHNGKSTTAPTARTDTDAVPASTGPPMVTAAAPTLASSETILAPYDWFFHPDRPLLNELELLYVQAVKPHEMMSYTFRPPVNVGEPFRRNVGFAPWLGVTIASGPTQGFPTYDPDVKSGLPALDTDANNPHKNVTGLGLYRALELLRGKSRTFGTATGGRVQGKVNLNTLQDVRVLIALLDPQGGSVFKTADVYDATNPSNTDTIWGRFMQSRTRTLSTRLLADGSTKVDTTIPGKTIDDDPYDGNWVNLDRPFKPFGVAEAGMPANFATTLNADLTKRETIVGGGNSVATDGATPTPNPTPFGPGLQDTLLRVDPRTKLPSNTPLPNGRAPLIYHLPEKYAGKGTALHPYFQAEPLRKMMNNVTTVSNVFAVHVTIVYHNVRPDPTNPTTFAKEVIPGVAQPRAFIGSEAFIEVPGDMRRQYFAIVDRSNAMVGSASSNTPMTNLAFQAATASDFTLTSGTGKFTLANFTLDTKNQTVSVASDGQVFTLSASGSPGTVKTIFVGSGADRVSVDITSIDVKTTPGQISVTQPAMGTTTRTFPAGSVVSNGIPGRVAIPAPFTPLQTPGTFPYVQLVPYAGRVR